MSVRRQRFEKVATKRVDTILKTLDLLGNCSNPYNYEYSKEDVDKIFKAINIKITEVKVGFNSQLNKERFSL